MSIVGLVSGGKHKEVTPALAAAVVSLCMVPLYDWPGSRNLTLRSIKPGQTILFVASITLSAVKSLGGLMTEIIFPSANYQHYQ